MRLRQRTDLTRALSLASLTCASFGRIVEPDGVSDLTLSSLIGSQDRWGPKDRESPLPAHPRRVGGSRWRLEPTLTELGELPLPFTFTSPLGGPPVPFAELFTCLNDDFPLVVRACVSVCVIVAPRLIELGEKGRWLSVSGWVVSG